MYIECSYNPIVYFWGPGEKPPGTGQLAENSCFVSLDLADETHSGFGDMQPRRRDWLGGRSAVGVLRKGSLSCEPSRSAPAVDLM